MRELHGDHFIDAGVFEPGTFFLRARQELQINVRRKDFHRMWVKGQNDCRSMSAVRRLNHLVQEGKVTEMMPIEIPNGTHRIRPHDLVRISAGHFHRRSMKQLDSVFGKIGEDQIGSRPFDRQERFHHGT